MLQTLPTQAPAGYVPETAVAFADQAGNAIVVDATHPLPVATTRAVAAPVLTGSATGTGLTAAFTPADGRAIWVILSGTWTGTVGVERSTDGGTTSEPLTVAGERWALFTANAQEPVAEDDVVGASYTLRYALTSGSLTYRVQQ